MQEKSNTSSYRESQRHFERIINQIYFFGQTLEIVYTILCVLWLIYIIQQLRLKMRRYKELQVLGMHSSLSVRIQNILTIQVNEAIIRNYIFLIFIVFELTFCLSINVYGIINYEKKQLPKPVFIGRNCTLASETYLSTEYDTRSEYVILNINASIISFAFSMMIWMFGASLLHLSYAARNMLNTKKICQFILIGIVVNIIKTTLMLIPCITLFGASFHFITDQLIFFVVLYIAKKKFFPALRSRVIDAFHICINRHEFKRQQKLEKEYRVLVTFLMITFEMFILKDLIFYNGYILIQSISINSCWFHATYNFPIFTFSESIVNQLFLVSNYFVIILRSIDLIVYFSLILISVLCMCSTVIRYLQVTLRERRVYRYRIMSGFV